LYFFEGSLSLSFEILAFLGSDGQGAWAFLQYMGILNGRVEKEFYLRGTKLVFGLQSQVPGLLQRMIGD
jgi:hypothetical protein